jgi:hypothetical protein
MSQTLRLGLGLLAWSGLARGVLEFRRIPGEYTHSLCGPWGCSPPLQALVAMHGFWVLATVPPAVWAIRTQSPGRLRLIGGVLVATALVGLVGVLGWESWVWTHRFSGRWGDYLPQRVAMAVATSADLPLLQVLVAGVAIARRRSGLGADPLA